MNSGVPAGLGRLYGIGLGPGDPELVTGRASRLLGSLDHVFAPKADEGSSSIARRIAEHHMRSDTQLRELVYPMTRSSDVLRQHWKTAAQSVVEVLVGGKDAGFVTLGDPMLYSTCAYLIRAVRELLPSVEIEVVPGVTSFCASAALTEFVLGEQQTRMVLAPAPTSLEGLRELTHLGGRLVLMKVGARLPELSEWLGELGLLRGARLVSRAGLPGERVVSHLESGLPLEPLGYLSTLLVDLDAKGQP